MNKFSKPLLACGPGVAIAVESASKASVEMVACLKAEIEKYGRIVRAIGLKIN